jgi:hypothetical protein
VTTRLADGSFVSHVESTGAAAPQSHANDAPATPTPGKRGKKSKS